MAGSLFTMPRAVGLDAGVSLPGAKLYFYEAGGAVVPKNTYSDADLAVGHVHANPVVADADGLFAPIYVLPDAYYVQLTTAAGVIVWDQDNVSGRGQYASAHAFSVARVSAQNADSGSNVQVQFNVESLDTDSQFDATTDYRFEPTIDNSIWLFTLQVTFQSMTGVATISIFTSQGSGVTLATEAKTIAGTAEVLSCSGVNTTPFTTGDYVMALVLHTHGSTRTLTGQFTGTLVGLV
jgi:hypothetical protein